MPAPQPTAGQKAFRSLGLTVLLVTLVYVLILAFTVSSAVEGSQLKRLGLMAAMLAAAAAVGAMLVDAFDLWMRGRRLSAYSLKMLHSLVFVAMVTAFILTIVVPGAALMLTITPALLIYLFAVVRRPAPAATSGSAGRQRRGGRRRR